MITLSVKILIIILTSSFLISCAPYYSEDQKWIHSLETLPKATSGYFPAGIFQINGKILAQRCDNNGNQLWWKYDEETHSWSRGKYVTHGCTNDYN